MDAYEICLVIAAGFMLLGVSGFVIDWIRLRLFGKE